MITKIEISGYKSIKNQVVELGPINVLIGANGAGKSNFISFLELFQILYSKQLKRYSSVKGADSLLFFGRKTTQEIHGRIEFKSKYGDKNAYEVMLEANEDNKLFVSNESVYFFRPDNEKTKVYGKGWTYPNRIGYAQDESSLQEDSSRQAGYIQGYFQQFKVFHFHDTTVESSLRNPCRIKDNKELRENGGNLSAFLYYLQEKHQRTFLQIEEIVKFVAPYFGGFLLYPDNLNQENIVLEWYEINHPKIPLSVNHLSDGTLRFIALTTLLKQPNPPQTIIIDEPELGLHPAALDMLSGLIETASKDVQIIVSTQSVTLVDKFLQEHIITVDLRNSESIFERLDSKNIKDWLKDFSLGDLWQMSEINGQPF